MRRRQQVFFISSLVLVVGAAFAWIAVPRLYRALDAGYQKAMDPVRIKDTETIAGLILEYAEVKGRFPFEEHTAERPFMVLIGHSRQQEDAFAQEKVLARNALFANADTLEAELSKVLERPIVLPRDPQKVATYAPNIYIYFVAEGQMSVIAHLFHPSDQSVRYEWRDGAFYSHTLTCTSRKQEELNSVK